jgi:redox-sensitive bicupin YhaK (pirin superfamily)
LKWNRRRLLTAIVSFTGVSVFAGWLSFLFAKNKNTELEASNMILSQQPISFQWPVQEPFLFCVHHFDLYPKGEADFGPPKQSLLGRDLGQDFDPHNAFRMYHGDSVPGFPVHPHRGFETITVVRKGYVDHADSMGAAGRYGEGDVQWMTAGAGVQHSEMFPLIKKDQENTVELFQIWLNLPKRSKMAKPHFSMFWSESIPKITLKEEIGTVELIAGDFAGLKALTPPPDSWASDPQNEVLILLVKINAGKEFKLKKSLSKTNRSLYFYSKADLELNGTKASGSRAFFVDSHQDLLVKAGNNNIEFLVLQAKTIGEPIVQHGPFVMNSKEEIVQTISDYQRTQFGGWSWPRHDMVHGDKLERFAKYPDGKIEKPKV